MIVNIDLMFFYELLIGFAGGGFFIGFILPLIMGGKPVRLFFSAKLKKKPVLLVWRPDRKIIGSIPSYIADVWRGLNGRKEYGLYHVYPDAIADFHGVHLAVADALNRRILPISVYKALELARKKGYKTVKEFIQALKQDAEKNGYNPETDYVKLDPPKLSFAYAKDVDNIEFNGDAVRISDLEKLFGPGDSSAYLMQLQAKYTQRALLETERSLMNYIGIGMMLMFTFLGLYFLLQGMKSMGWLHTIHLLVMSLV